MSIIAHQFHPRSIRVEFGTEVSSSALDASVYQIVVNTVDSSEPWVESVSYYDSTHTSVILSLSSGLTVDSQYTLHTSEIEDASGGSIDSSSYNLIGTVPDKPHVVGAFLSLYSHIDIVFDRPVGPYSPGATATLNVNPDGGSDVLTLIEWSDSIPNTAIRFEYEDVFDPGSEFVVDFAGVCDSSYNASSGSVRLSIPTRASEPFSYEEISTIQVTDAWVESYVPALGKIYLNVVYNAPLVQADADDLSNYSLDIPTSHLDADTIHVPDSAATDDTTAITLAADLKEQFNAHITDDRVHLASAPVEPRIDRLIRLTNDLWRAFNAHIQDTDVHLTSNISNATTVGRASSLATCITLLNNLQSKFNLHIDAAGVHPSSDGYAMSDWPESTDIKTMAEYADEMRVRMQMHFGLPFHLTPDERIRPVSFCQSYITFPWAITIYDAAAIAVECQYKFASHFLDKTHVYRDVYNGIRPIIYPVVGDSAAAVAAINSIRNRYSDHIAQSKTVNLTEVYINMADENQSLDSNESSYQIQYSVDFPGAPDSPLSFFATVSAPDDEAVTSPESFTGSINARALPDNPKLLQSLTTPGKLTLKFDKELSAPRPQDVRLSTISGKSIRVVSVELAASPQSLYAASQRLAHALQSHNDESLGAVHKVADEANEVVSSEFLDGTMDGAFECLNAIKDAYNAHATDLAFHEGIPSSFAVSAPYAEDMQSAINLAADLLASLRAHNLDGAHHSAPGRDVLLGKLFDTLIIYHDEVSNGTECSVEAILPRLIRYEGGADEVKPFAFQTSFTAVSDSPVLAAAIPRSGLSSSGDIPVLVKDRVDLYFSKPMLPNPIPSGNIEMNPSAGVGNIFWTGDHTATIEVSGTTSSTQYDITVSDVRDKSGNPIE